jgi:putative transposase
MDFSLSRERSELDKNHPLSGWRPRVIHPNHPSARIVIVQATNKAKKGDLMVNTSNSLAHTKWMCKYHIIFAPKYRRKIIYNQYRESIGGILRQLCKYKGVEIIEGHLMVDPIHMLVSIPPKISVSSFMGYLKGKSALMIFDKHANLKYKFGNRHFWAEGYYVSTVGLNEATIKKYIEEQEKQDIAMDKLSVKEYEDPFRG